MESALPLLLFLLFLFGSTLLILATGCASRISEVFEEEPPEAASPPAAPAGLFGGRSEHDATSWNDAAVLSSVENYLENEERMAEEFVQEPSADRLYRRPHLPTALDDSFSESLESFLEVEQTQAEDFVSNPSLDKLFGHFGFRAIVG